MIAVASLTVAILILDGCQELLTELDECEETDADVAEETAEQPARSGAGSR